jgi:glycosyltransferase involved in cell wall biosynthesis
MRRRLVVVPERPRVSALVITYNEEDHLRECLESLSWCDEILVVDSFSTDRTAEIARSYPRVRFFQRPFLGGAAQRNWGMERASHDWILILDADERCTDALRREIETLLVAGPAHDAYTVRRRVWFLEKRIRFSGMRRDRAVRLVRRGRARYDGRRVHELLVPRNGGAPLLRSPLEHFTADSLHEYLQRITKYAWWGAAQHWREGRRAGWPQIFVRTFWRFFRTYFLQLGVLDGTPGLVFCLLQASATYQKWALLWSWHHDARRGVQPILPAFEEDAETGLPGSGEAEGATRPAATG